MKEESLGIKHLSQIESETVTEKNNKKVDSRERVDDVGFKDAAKAMLNHNNNNSS